jgi:integrase
MSTGEKDLDKAKKAIKVMLVEPIHRSPEGSKVRVDADMVLWEGELPSGGVVPGMLPAVQQAPSRPVMPWQDAFERFVGSLTCSRKRAEEIRGSKKIYAEHFSDKATDAITPADVEGIKVGLHKKGRKAKTIREHIQVLRQFFRWCEVHGLVDSNPATKITPPHGEAREGIPFTHEEAVKLLQACREPHVFNAPRGGRRSRIPPDWLHLSIFIGLRTGLRRANILGMCWHQIDLDARRISFEAKDMKMRRRHEVPIHIELLEVLHDMQARLNPKPEDRLIPREGHTVYNRWIGLIARAGLKGRRIHDMRHTVETWLAQNGVEPTLRDAILGHVKGGGSMTARYTHWQWEDLVAAMDKMPRLLP